MSIHTCNIASAIPASTTVPSAPSATFAVSARYSVHTKTYRICEQKKFLIICTQSHRYESDILICWPCFAQRISSWTTHNLKTSMNIWKALLPQELQLVHTIHPLGFEGRNLFTKGSLLCNIGQHMHNKTVKRICSQTRAVFRYSIVVKRTAAQINPSRNEVSLSSS